jgi:hypothetical protein
MFRPLDTPRTPWQHLAAAFRRPFWWSGARPAALPQDADWRRDPLSHPALRGMTQRELGDLPFDPRAVLEE